MPEETNAFERFDLLLSRASGESVMTDDKTTIATYVLLFAVIVVAAAVLMSGIKWDLNNKAHLNSPAQPLSDEEYMRLRVVNYLGSQFDTPAYRSPNYDVSLEDIAVDNAIKGNSLWIPTSGNTAEEALKTFIAVDGSHSTCGAASFWLDTNQRDYPGTTYAVGVYKTSYSQYNISVVFTRQNHDTQEMNRNGAFVTMKHNPSTINFVPPCAYDFKYERWWQ